MSTLTGETVLATDVAARNGDLVVELSDGRTIIVPLLWYPRLANATVKELKNWRLIAGGEGIHWADLDEDVSVRNLLQGQPSGESQKSFQRWLNGRKRRPKR